ncbi:MAG: hypothetical protein ABIO86_15585 [Sphingomonas sp.]
MGTLRLEHRTVTYQWASDIDFDGIRLEVLTNEGDMLFDVSVPNDGPITINTFGTEIAADLMMAAVEIARRAR